MVKLVYEDWISKGKKARVVDSFKTDHGYILLELLKHKDGYFIGISRNMAYPDMESWISCYTVASDDAYDIFNYIKDNVTDGTWWELTNLMKKSGFKYKLQSILNCTDREMNPNYVTRKNESMKRNRYRGLDTVDESIGESYRANRIGLKESFNSALDNIQMYIDNINVRFPCKDGDLDIWDNGDGTYKIVIMDDMGRVVRDVTQSKRPNSLVIDIKGVYDILKIWN